MKHKSKKKVLQALGDARFGSFLSVGELLGIEEYRLQNAIKLQFLPQWEELGNSESVLSKRSVLVDIRTSDLSLADMERVAKAGNLIGQAAQEDPELLLKIVRAYGRSGEKEEREKTLGRAERLGLWSPDDSEPAAIIGAVLLVGAAILIAGCCVKTDTDCSDPGPGNGDGTGGKPE